MNTHTTDVRMRHFTDGRLLDVRDLTVRYKRDGDDAVTVLERIGFAVETQESIGVLGESGAGKTTLVLAILGLLPLGAAVSGTVDFRGRDLIAIGESAFRSLRGAAIAFIPQEPAQALNPVICVGQQVTDIIRAHFKVDRKTARSSAETALQEVGLCPVDRIYSAFPHQLSGGQRQRVVIAQALVCNPALLIADEPTSSLDQITQSQVLSLLRALQQKHGFSLLLISHDPWIVAEMVTRIIVLREGRIIDQGPTGQMFASRNSYTRSLLGCVQGQAYAQ